MALRPWTIIIPVKRLAAGKSRLRAAAGPALADDDLVLAIAADTVAAVRDTDAVASVLVVTDDPRVGAVGRDLGCRVLGEPAGAGLNAAIAHGEHLAGTGGHRGALLADLAALRPADLAAALEAAATLSPPRRSFVTDHTGTGTTLLLAPPGIGLAPRFGGGSAAAHAESGAYPLPGTWPSLRLDVDTPDDLGQAAALGLGARTGATLASRRVTLAAYRWAAAAPPTGTIDAVQGTVARFDPQRRDGAVLLDDGTEIPFPADAFDASGLRLLRFGQRVRLETVDGDRVTRIALVTM